jgi:hypothetical protein
MTGQTLGMTATVQGGALSCGATPMLTGDAAGLAFDLSACGGCDACDCIDQGYQYSNESPAPAPGAYTLRVGAHSQTLSVVPREQCNEMPPLGPDGVHAEVVVPDFSLRSTGPRLTWLHVTGTESRCCGQPTLAASVAGIRPANADLGVTLYECAPDPCGCVGSPHPFETWVELGALAPGQHGVVVSGASGVVQFTVPGIR